MIRSVLFRTRSVCLIVAGILIGGAFRVGAAPCVDPVDRNIGDYVLFALDEMVIKDGAQLLGGNVGVNGCGLLSGNPRLRFGGSAFMSDGAQAVSDTARITSDASIDEVFVNTISGNPPVVPRTCGPTPFACADCANNGCIVSAANLAAFIASECGDFATFTICPSNNVTVASGTTVTLPPGCYGDVRVNDHGTLILGSGQYNFKSLSLGKFVTVYVTDQTHVDIAENVFMNVRAFIGLSNGKPSCGAVFCVRSDGITNGNSVGFSSGGNISGQWIVPNGKVDLGASTIFHGRILARSFGSDPNITITFCVPCGCECP
jgi:hypothetical protein